MDFFVLNLAMEALFQLFAVSHYLDLHSMVIHYLCLGWKVFFLVDAPLTWLEDCFD